MKSSLGVLFVSFIIGVQILSAQSGDSLYLRTKTETVAGLVSAECGPDFCLNWNPSKEAAPKKTAYLIFVRRNASEDWRYFHYVHDTCFVHYGAALFYPEIAYEVHAYYGSVRVLPGYSRDPQDPRLPGEAIRDFWEPPFFDPQRR